MRRHRQCLARWHHTLPLTHGLHHVHHPPPAPTRRGSQQVTDQPNTPPPETPHRSDHDASWPEAETATEPSTTPRPTPDAPAESTTATAPAAEKPDNTSVATKKRHRLRTPPTGSTNHPTPTETNPSGKRQGNRPRKAHTSSGRCCRNAAIKGGTVCPMHGGSAPQVIASAKQRLLEAAEPAVRTLRKAIGAVDKDRQPSAVAVRAAEATR